MKKLFITSLAICALSLSLNAVTIDTSKASASFTAFKTAKKVGVNGTFDGIVFKFGKKQDSIASTLEGASATMEAMNINLGDATKNESLKKNFFSKFNKDKKNQQLIKVTFRNVIEGENTGTILASVSMNNRSQKIPMQYTIKDDTIEVKGVLDVLDFGLAEQFKSLSLGCKDLHEGLTWSQVEISIKAPLK